MRQQLMAIPVACNKCGELFDMRYDMKKGMEEEIEEELENHFTLQNKNSLLCWQCRSF